MNTFVKFIVVDLNKQITSVRDYIENIVDYLISKGVINAPEIDDATSEFGEPSAIIEDEERIYITNFIHNCEGTITRWQLTFEFGTFTSSQQLQIIISSDNYTISVNDNYLEQLKLQVKNFIKDDWTKIIWLFDKDSEALSINLYSQVYITENMARQLINEIMTKEYGVNWWDTYVPLLVKNKHKARLGGYKSIVPGFANVDERLMSIDIGDLNAILTLVNKKWNPGFNADINSYLNEQIDISQERLKNLLLSQMIVDCDLWKEQFSNYLSEDFIKHFKTFELNRNHIVHNKLIDRAAYNSILNSINVVEKELREALAKIGTEVISREQKAAREQLLELEQQQFEAHMLMIMESESGVRIRNAETIVEFIDYHLDKLHTEITEHLRFRSDIEISVYEHFTLAIKEGVLFEINYRIANRKATVSYSVDLIDESQGAESRINIVISDNETTKHNVVTYTNGEVYFDSFQSNFLPEIQDSISNSDLEELKESILEYIENKFENVREKVDRDMYSIIKHGGNIPVADVPCWACGEDYICVDEEYGTYGQCLNCGEQNSVSICDRCGCYYEEAGDGSNICDNCWEDIDSE